MARMHCCLDVNLDEDKCHMRKDNNDKNLVVIRHISFNHYKCFDKVKMSMKAKCFRYAFDDNFLCSVIFNKFF